MSTSVPMVEPPRWTVAVLWLHAVSFIGFGAWGFVSPYSLMDVVELAPDGPGALVDFRATYGGLVMGVGIGLAACARQPGWLRPGLSMAAAVYGGFAVCRGLGMLMVLAAPVLQGQIAATEGVMCLLALAALRAARPPADADPPPPPLPPTGAAPTA